MVGIFLVCCWYKSIFLFAFKKLVFQLVAGWIFFGLNWLDYHGPVVVRIQSPPTLWVRTPLRIGVLDTTLCDEVCLRLLRFPPIKMTFIRYINWIWYILIKSCENVNRPVIVLTHVVWHYHQNDSRSILLYTWGRRVRLMVLHEQHGPH
jgi:hypothetical protein